MLLVRLHFWKPNPNFYDPSFCKHSPIYFLPRLFYSYHIHHYDIFPNNDGFHKKANDHKCLHKMQELEYHKKVDILVSHKDIFEEE